MDLEQLKTPLTPKWRVQSVRGGKAICVPYIDARQAHELFDTVCGAEKWQNTYDAETGVAAIGIFLDNDWVWKTDVGTESNVEKTKGKASDAFKRAAVLWGVGRDLYQKGTKVLAAKGKVATTREGKELWSGDQLSNYINGLSEGVALLMQIWNLNKELHEDPEFKKTISSLKTML
jgi:hypothetical protein